MSDTTVHQLLHGYRRGHERLAGSIRLPDRDADLITRLSDLSGSLAAGLKFDSYLTLYPLPSGRYYAIARTWPDPDAPRAGCVLTHTILLPNEYWARLPRPQRVGGLFRRPRGGMEHHFESPLSAPPPDAAALVVDEVPQPLPKAQLQFVSRYFGDGVRPVVWLGVSDPEPAMWSVVQASWPKLRLAFACCTFSLQQRTLEDRPFDLLFAPKGAASRFTKLTAEHIVDEAAARKDTREESEAWCRHWTSALFARDSAAARGPLARELPVWDDLSEDPTGVRRLFLVHELQDRAAHSPTAGVGAIDVVESLARGATVAVALKRQIITDAIAAAESAASVKDGLTSLRLIDERLRREAFREVAADVGQHLAVVTAKVAVKEPDAAVAAGAPLISTATSSDESSFAQGLMSGLRHLAAENPGKLQVLQSYPDVAYHLLRVEPKFGPLYLKFGGLAARRQIAEWLGAVRDSDTLRSLRTAILPLLIGDEDGELLSRLLRELPAEEVPDALNVLARSSNGFTVGTARLVVSDRVATVHPEQVRDWARAVHPWSAGISAVVASTFTANRRGLIELLESPGFGVIERAQMLASMLHDQGRGRFAYWLREAATEDLRVVSVLLAPGSKMSETVETALQRLLAEVPDIPVAQSAEVTAAAFKLHGRSVFPALLEATMRSAVIAFVFGHADRAQIQSLQQQPAAVQWLRQVPGWTLASLLTHAVERDSKEAGRAWLWLADAPSEIYRREPRVVPELCESLTRSLRHALPADAATSMVNVLRRARVEGSEPLRFELCARLLRFSLDNTRLAVSAIICEAFPDVYKVVSQPNRPPSLVANLFAYFDWDKGKELRSALIEAFLSSSWPPGDLAVAADGAGILRKVFKRLHRKARGDEYARSMFEDLVGRNDSRLLPLRDRLRELISDPDFYEEWD